MAEGRPPISGTGPGYIEPPSKTKATIFTVILILIVIAGLLDAASRVRAADTKNIEPSKWFPTSDVRQVGGFWLSYDGRTKSARYVLEILTKESLGESEVVRASGFRSDPFVAPGLKAVDADYSGSGYDRGHLAPSANYHRKRENQRKSFWLSNAAPQTPESNRGPWKKIEQIVRDLAEDDSYAVVITAPLYLPSDGILKISTIGENDVWVPTHFGKAICVFYDYEDPLAEDTTPYTIAWIVPNTRSPGTVEECQSCIDDLEIAMGLDLFSVLPDKTEKLVEVNWQAR